MKILTIAGTRPELIRLSVIIRKLDELVDKFDYRRQSPITHILVYTNQNYDDSLSTQFFKDLSIRAPNYYFQKEATSVGDFLGNAFIEFEKIIRAETPDKILVLGDTNSGLLSIIGNKYGIPIYHMEAGNRCYDDRLPEEANRRIIDAISKYNLPYTENSKQNLLNEGFHKNYVFKTGNPICEVLMHYNEQIENSKIIETEGLTEYILVTMHRAENVNNKESLGNIISAINILSSRYTFVISMHPHTKQKMKEFNLSFSKCNSIIVIDGFGFFDFVKLEKNARCIITDSGTVPEECCIFHIPVITIRESTERQELIECGSNILVGTNTDTIIKTLDMVNHRTYTWSTPDDYMRTNVSDVVINLLIGK